MNSKPKKREKLEPKREEGERLKEERNRQGWTQYEAAEGHLNMAESTYRNWETGRVRIPETRIQEVAAVFGVRAEYLRGNDNFRTEEDYKKYAIAYYYEQQREPMIEALKHWRGKMIDAILASRGYTREYMREFDELPARYAINDHWYIVDTEKANSLFERVSEYLAFLITQEKETDGNGND